MFPPRPPSYDTVIVGAGITGLYLSMKLRGSVVVLESSGRAGGRVKQADFHGQTVQLGAGIVRESDSRVLELARSLGLRVLPKTGNYGCALPNYSRQWFNDLVGALPTLDVRATESFGEFLRRHFPKETVDMFVQCSNYTDFLDADARSVIHRYPLEDMLHGPKRYYVVEGGYQRLVDRMYELTKARVRLHCSVREVTRADDSWVLTTSMGVVRARRVVFCVDRRSLGKVRFRPTTPAAVAATLKSVRCNPFLRLYTAHGRSTVTRPWIVTSPLKQVVPVGGAGVIMTYCDCENAEAMKEVLEKCRDVSRLLNTALAPAGEEVGPERDRLVAFWECGTHSNRPGYFPRAQFLEGDGVAVVGELLSHAQGWNEGALASAEEFLQRVE